MSENPLIAGMLRNRQSKTTVGRFTFLWRRPTTVEMLDLRGKSMHDACCRCVYGWEGVTVNDLIRGGDSSPAEFSPEAWEAWSADRSDFWVPIWDDLLAAYNKYIGSLEDAGKKE